MLRLLSAGLGFCLLILAAGGADAAKRAAFVVGIDAYDNLSADRQLKKAVNDAHAVAGTLESLGYQVQSAENTTRLDFLRQWQLFLNRIEPGDEVAVFFAGHGVEIDGQNFLLPRDVPRIETGEEEVLKASGIPVGSLLDQVRDRRPQVSLYVFDACRDNPFLDSKGRSIGGTRGLSRIEPPSGTFIMFSAGARETALDRLSDDDPNPNSVYTRTLLPKLKTRGKITDIARDVRREVRELAASVAHVQTPAYYDEVVGEFCPAGCGEEQVATAEPAKPEPAAPAQQPVPAPQVAPAPPVETPQPAAEVKLPPRESLKTVMLTPRSVGPIAADRAPVQECDRLAGSPGEPDAVVAYPEPNEDNRQAAVKACEEAVNAYPQERRFAFQLAKAYFYANEPERAKPILDGLSRGGYPIATTYLGYFSATGRVVPRDEQEAVRLFRQAADAGDLLGLGSLAAANERGAGVEKNEAEAVALYRKAADKGAAGAAIRLGDAYAQGQLGLPKDGAVALDWYAKAASLGSIEAVYRAGVLYQEGAIVPKDEAEAARLFALGDAEKQVLAMTDIGQRLYGGYGVTKNEAEGLRWFQKAADLGSRTGMFYLALASRYGSGTPKNEAEAVRWYRSAAAKGDALAMTSLAEMYEKGEGVTKDPLEAKRWRTAANEAISSAGYVAPNPGAERLVTASLAQTYGPEEYAPAVLAFSPSGDRLFVLFSGGFFKALDVASGTFGDEFGNSDPSRGCCKLQVSQDGKYLATGSYDDLALIWSARTGALVKSFKGHADDVATIAMAPDGRLLASGSADKTIKIWDIDTGLSLRSLDGHTDRVNAVAFSPDGAMLASGGWDQSIKFWDVASGSLVKSLGGHSGIVQGLAFSGDGTRLVSLGSDTRIRVWDVPALKEILNFGVGLASVCCFALSPDGAIIASGGSDSMVRLWETKSGALIANLDQADAVQALAFSPDGAKLAVGTNDKLIKLWDLKRQAEARQ